MTGICKFFRKGYGFITRDDGKGDIFVHFSDIVSTGYKVLNENDKVEFELGSGDRGEKAVNVTKVE